MPRLVDCHTHTRYSDGSGEVADVVRSARDAGCSTVVISDHLTLPHDMDPGCECSVAERGLPSLLSDVRAAREANPDVKVVQGFECDWYPGCEDDVTRWSRGATFLLGSVHWVADGWIDDPDDLHVWKQLGPDEVWREYADAWCAACESTLAFDSMAHPDLPRRFANEGLSPTIDLTPLWDRMASCARDTGRHVEVSTAGLRKSVRGYYPEAGLLLAFHDAGTNVTVGSDAHRPKDVGWGIRDAYAYARAAGYESIDVPCPDGGWERLSIA
jgi:histidinol-phosphatase (PHP family)